MPIDVSAAATNSGGTTTSILAGNRESLKTAGYSAVGASDNFRITHPEVDQIVNTSALSVLIVGVLEGLLSFAYHT